MLVLLLFYFYLYLLSLQYGKFVCIVATFYYILKDFENETIVKEAKDANLLSQESKLTRVNLQLNLCPSK